MYSALLSFSTAGLWHRCSDLVPGCKENTSLPRDTTWPTQLLLLRCCCKERPETLLAVIQGVAPLAAGADVQRYSTLLLQVLQCIMHRHDGGRWLLCACALWIQV